MYIHIQAILEVVLDQNVQGETIEATVAHHS